MKRILPLILSAVMLLSLVSFPISAEETITDLKKVYNNLSTYLFEPFYEESEYFEDYKATMEEIGTLLESDSITQAEIVKYYNELRSVYSKLMQDTYDYSSLYTLLESYEALDGSLFTEESWKKLLSVRDSAKKELDAPSLFAKSDELGEKEYTNYINRHIRTFTANFKNAFQSLEFSEKPEEITSAYLAAYAKLIKFCAREELFAEAEGWDDFQDALKEAEKSASLNKPKEGRLDRAYTELDEAYAALCKTLDYSASQEALTKFHVLSEKSFTADSWSRYANAANDLQAAITASHYIFIPLGADQESCKEYTKAYLDSLPSVTTQMNDLLVTMESYNRLANLCEKNKDRTTMEGLDIKLNLLLSRVQEGQTVLADKDATKQSVETAIKNIAEAESDLIMAEGHLLEEQSKVVKQDSKTSQFTVIFIVSSILLSALFAIFLSRYYYGKVNWTK